MEFGGPGLSSLSMDERATLANMATECTARGGIVEADEETVRWIAQWRPGVGRDRSRARTVEPDAGAVYAGGVHRIDLSTIAPMVATPGDPDRGIASDPTNGALVDDLGEVKIDIAYGGSCTAGKIDDIALLRRVAKEAVDAGPQGRPGRRLLHPVRLARGRELRARARLPRRPSRRPACA